MKQLFKTLLQKTSPDILGRLFLRRMHLFILEINNKITELQGTSMLLSFLRGDLFVFSNNLTVEKNTWEVEKWASIQFCFSGAIKGRLMSCLLLKGQHCHLLS